MRATGEQFIETYSKPIHSCSKLAQIRRKAAEARKDGEDVPSVKGRKKRARCDDLIERLKHIEDVQQAHTCASCSIGISFHHLRRLLKEVAVAASSPTSSAVSMELAGENEITAVDKVLG